VVGPVLSALTPVTLAYAVIDPGSSMVETLSGSGGLGTARASLGIGAVLSSLIYIFVVYGIRANMVRNFDFTVRRLAGER